MLRRYSLSSIRKIQASLNQRFEYAGYMIVLSCWTPLQRHHWTMQNETATPWLPYLGEQQWERILRWTMGQTHCALSQFLVLCIDYVRGLIGKVCKFLSYDVPMCARMRWYVRSNVWARFLNFSTVFALWFPAICSQFAENRPCFTVFLRQYLTRVTQDRVVVAAPVFVRHILS